MASHAIQSDLSQTPLSADEGWELILQSFGSGKQLYTEHGGGAAWLRSERESWNPGGTTEEHVS